MSTPPAPQGAPTWSPPSGGAIASKSEPDSPSSDGTSSPPAPATGSSSIASSSTPPPANRARAPAIPASGGGGSPPPGCAVCRHKRQRCPPGCDLAPYFPADDPDRFRSVLRVFGVKNLLRTLREVPRPRWDACVRTIVHESRMRLADPVRGCVGEIEDLEAQLVDTAVELEVLRRRQEAYRQARRRGLRLQPPNPSPGRADAASPRGGALSSRHVPWRTLEQCRCRVAVRSGDRSPAGLSPRHSQLAGQPAPRSPGRVPPRGGRGRPAIHGRREGWWFVRFVRARVGPRRGRCHAKRGRCRRELSFQAHNTSGAGRTSGSIGLRARPFCAHRQP
ncbi:hypothetical protein C2845_PM15G07920 [Panicum miliaceum]|uniref:LOB domain-containing protein n=1 Tax=Panicum miliaceum TaxID=4540 RepID=A0A3L6Q7S8_PANMI|nr:hypothetical protein C2845_PM15G07920 [Panicum miliaceum]